MGTFGDTRVGGDTKDGDVWGHQGWGITGMGTFGVTRDVDIWGHRGRGGTQGMGTFGDTKDGGGGDGTPRAGIWGQ